jgi:hypothetical protein
VVADNWLDDGDRLTVSDCVASVWYSGDSADIYLGEGFLRSIYNLLCGNGCHRLGAFA